MKTYTATLFNGQTVNKRSATRAYPYAVVSFVPGDADNAPQHVASFASTLERAEREAAVLVTPGIQRRVIRTVVSETS